MKILSLTFALFFITLTTFSQQKMKTVEELINTTEPGWTLVEKWIAAATNKVEVLPADAEKAKDALYKTQVTTRSPMGAIIYATGGILIDNGWIRVLGSGHSKLNRTLPDWNKGKSINEFGEAMPFLLIADDAIGGFFAINGGAWGSETAGKIYYLSPDTLEWENLDLSYTEFLLFCFSGKMDEFYDKLRWDNWIAEASILEGDKAFHFIPFLWTAEGKDINKNSRKAIPVEELYSLTMDLRKQLGQ